MREEDMELKGIEKACNIFIEQADEIMKGNNESDFVLANQGLSTGQSMVKRFSGTAGIEYQNSCRVIYQRLEDKKSELNKAYEQLMGNLK